MIEVIHTEKNIIDMENNGVFVEISIVRTEKKLEMELYTFKEHPTKDRLLLLKCVGKPGQEHEFLTTIYAAVDNPKEWIERHREDGFFFDFNED